MKIILDNIIFSLQEKGGITTYWLALLDGLRKFSEESEYTNLIEIKPKILNRGLSGKIGVLLDRYKRLKIINKNEKYVFHSSYYRTLKIKFPNVKQIVTIHDFTYELFAKGFKKHLHIWQKKSAIKYADIIICVSENTKRDLLKFYPQFSNKKIRVIYHGYSNDYFRIENNFNHKNYFLYVGSRESHKNFPFAVESISNYTNTKLVIVGKRLKKSEEKLLNKYLPNNWELFDNVSNSKLNILYNDAFALIYPSIYEGFGIPLIEAMASGCPFIALNNSSIPEVAGNAGVLLNSLNGLEFKEAYNKIQNERQLMVQAGFEQVKNFSWEKCIKETINTYCQAFI